MIASKQGEDRADLLMGTTVKFTFDTHFDGPEPRNEKERGAFAQEL